MRHGNGARRRGTGVVHATGAREYRECRRKLLWRTGVVHATGAREGAREWAREGESIKIWVGFLERI